MGRQELEDFLGDRYTDEKKLRAFVAHTFGKTADKAIGWGSGLATACNELITWIESKGDVAKLWPALRSDNPNYVADVDKHESAWVVEPSVADRSRSPNPVIPFWRRIGVRIGAIAVAVAACGVIVTVHLLRTEQPSLIIVPDKHAQGIMGGENPFTLVIGDGLPTKLPRDGFVIGKGDVLPDEVADQYRKYRPTGTPHRVDTKLTSKLVSELKVFYESTPCPKPEIDIEKDSVWLVQLDHCR